MKIYKKEQQKVTRIEIRGGKNKSGMVTLIDTNVDEAFIFSKEALKKEMFSIASPVLELPPIITICVYDSIGNEKLKPSKSFRILGDDGKYIEKIIKESLL